MLGPADRTGNLPPRFYTNAVDVIRIGSHALIVWITPYIYNGLFALGIETPCNWESWVLQRKPTNCAGRQPV